MRYQSFSLVSFLVFFLCLILVQTKADGSNKLVVGSVSSVDMGKAQSCKRETGKCKEDKGGSEERVFENEDYIYTQSLP
ncbi:hypothetical protein LguiA_013589 [Lonicera macranthoides]